MAIVARYHELRKEIEALVAENEELKQLVQLLRENQELRAALRHNESSLLPVFESSRINEQEPLANQAFLESSGWERSSFVPSLRPALRQRQRHPTEIIGPVAQQIPLTSSPVGSARPVALRHPTFTMSLQQPADTSSLPRRQAPPRYRTPPSNPGTASPVNDGFCPNFSIPDTNPNDSLQRTGPRGFCYECPVPWHPHLALFSPPPSGSGSSSFYPPDSSLASPPMGRTYTVDMNSNPPLPSIQNLSELSSVFLSDTSPLSSRYLQPAAAFSYPSDLISPGPQNVSQPVSGFGSPCDMTPLSGRYLQPAVGYSSDQSFPSTQNLSQLNSANSVPADMSPLGNQYLQPPPRLIFNFPSVRSYPSTQNLSVLPSVFGSPGQPFNQNLSQLSSVFATPCEVTPLSCRYLQPAVGYPSDQGYPSSQNYSQLNSANSVPGDVAPLSNRYLQRPPRLIFNFPSVRPYPSTQNLSLLPSVFGSPGQPFNQNLSQLSSVFATPCEVTPLSCRYLQPAVGYPSDQGYPSSQNYSQLNSANSVPGDVAPLSNRYLQRPPRLIFNFPSVRPYPSTQNLSVLPSVFGSPGQPFNQNLSQLSSVFGSPCEVTPLSSHYLQPPSAMSYATEVSYPSTQDMSQMTSVFGFPPGLFPPSTQDMSQLTSVFGFPPDLSPPSTQNISQLTSVFGFGSPENLSLPLDAYAASADAAAGMLPWNYLMLQSPYVSPSASPPAAVPGFNVPVLMQTTLQPLMLQNPSPFVLQPPPLGRKGRPLAPPTSLQPALGQPGAGGFSPAGPLQAPMDQQKLPDVRPKERRGPTKQDAAPKTNEDAKAKDSSKQERIVGEIAFQLDRRILSSIFPERIRLYGFTVRNIPEKVTQSGKDPFLPLTPELSAAILDRYNSVMERLRPLGYNASLHPWLTEHIVNTFGILRERPEATGPEAASYNNLQYLQDVVRSSAPPDMLQDCLLLLSCLCELAQDDGKPLFIW